MTSSAKSVDAYLAQLPEERVEAIQQLRNTLLKNLPKGFEETMGYGMLAYVFLQSVYPEGYHCDPKLPLPFINIASQKNFIALYHMGLYADTALLEWFTDEYPKHVKASWHMGKSCIRFKIPDQIPFKLIGELAKKMTPKQWIALYEHNLKQPRK